MNTYTLAVSSDSVRSVCGFHASDNSAWRSFLVPTRIDDLNFRHDEGQPGDSQLSWSLSIITNNQGSSSIEDQKVRTERKRLGWRHREPLNRET